MGKAATMVPLCSTAWGGMTQGPGTGMGPAFDRAVLRNDNTVQTVP